MQDMKMTGRGGPELVQVWISVTDANGSSRLESRWTAAEQGAEQAAGLHATYAA
jgi:hypothetical protein